MNIFLKIFLWMSLLILVASGSIAYIGYKMIFLPNVLLDNKQSELIYIPTNSTFNDVVSILKNKKILQDINSFIRLAEYKKYNEYVKPGRYRISNRLSNNELVNLLRSGIQEPISITFTNIRTKEQLISRVCSKLEADSIQLKELLYNNSYLQEKFGLNNKTILVLFLPNTYHFSWNTSAEQFLSRMEFEYKKFWNQDRLQKAQAINLNPAQVSILASIVQAEQMRFASERPIIAGLYLNRLRIGMPLQSDPTIIYALGNFKINRVLDKDKQVESLYNTYLHIGLPPGPINAPEISSIDAVLNFEKSKYLYMCAKEDFSGTHNFASTLSEHSRNARKYQSALNKCKIFR